MEKFDGEVAALKVVKHDNIVKMLNSNSDSTWVRPGQEDRRVAYIVLEFLQARELFDHIVQGGAFSEPVCRYFFR